MATSETIVNAGENHMLELKTSNIRNAVRVDLERPVWIRNEDGPFESARLANISESGAAVDWSTSLIAGEVHLILKLKEGSFLSLKARRAWQRNGRIGLSFDSEMVGVRNFLDTQVGARRRRSAELGLSA